MNKVLLICILIITAVSAYAEELKFRGLPFGSSSTDVIRQEGEPDKITETIDHGLPYIIFHFNNKTVAGYTASMSCAFIDGELSNGSYKIYLDNPNDAKECYNVFFDLGTKLNTIYDCSYSWCWLPELKLTGSDITEKALVGQALLERALTEEALTGNIDYSVAFNVGGDTIVVSIDYMLSEWRVLISYVSQDRMTALLQGQMNTDGL